MTPQFITVTYEVVDPAAFAWKSAMDYEHDGVKAVACQLGDAITELEKLQETHPLLGKVADPFKRVKNPQVGDVITKGQRSVVVNEFDGNVVRYTATDTGNTDGPQNCTVPIDEWRTLVVNTIEAGAQFTPATHSTT